MPTPATYVDSLANLTPLLVAVCALAAAIVSALGLRLGKKSVEISEKTEKVVTEIHVIVNSQKTEMVRKIDELQEKSDTLELSNEELKKMIMEMSKVLVESRVAEEVATKALVELQPAEVTKKPLP